MIKLSIDQAKKTVQVSVELKGEGAPIDVDVKHYELDSRDGKLFLVIHDLLVSKEWLNVLAQQVVKGKPFELGAGSKKVVDVMRTLNMV